MRSGRDDPIVLSILLTEMHFRPIHFRLLEYLSYAFFGKRRTVGIGQISTQYWEEQFSGRFGVVRAALSTRNNYDLCKQIIEKTNERRNPLLLLSHYTGCVTCQYYTVFERNFKSVNSIVEVRRKRFSHT
jgi:hypothetical protein